MISLAQRRRERDISIPKLATRHKTRSRVDKIIWIVVIREDEKLKDRCALKFPVSIAAFARKIKGCH
jgi:hypothetical protein